MYEILGSLWAKAQPGTALVADQWALIALAAAVAALSVPGLWRYTRLAVTIVHELGHAVVGIVCGRRFTGFVVNADMSGHTLTAGRSRGLGRVLSTWAGYPAPAILGAALLQVALGGWAPTVLAIVLVVLVLALPFSRSGHTVLTLLLAIVALGAAWWLGGDQTSAALVLAIGLFLLLGAWRHLGAVMAHGGRQDDPGQLARVTPLPSWVWSFSYLVVLAACSWWGWRAVEPLVRGVINF